MDSGSGPPGFDRVEVEGQKRAFYLSRPEELGLAPGCLPRKLNDLSQVSAFLTKENIEGVDLSQFDFRKSQKRTSATDFNNTAPKVAKASSVFAENGQDETSAKGGNRIFNMNHLMRPSTKVDHQKELETTAQELDLFRRSGPRVTDSAALAALKSKVASASTVGEMVRLVGATPEGMKEMGLKVEDACFQELLSVGAAEGALPLSEWPNDRAKNWFAQVVKFAQKFSPVTLSLLLRLIVHSDEENIGARHVICLATVYGLLAAQVDRTNNVLSKLNTLQLKMDGCTEEGIDALAPMGITHTSRHLRRQRDVIAEVADKLRIEETKNRPLQSTMDNCNQKESDTTVEYRQTESIDTRGLNSEPKSPAEVLASFDVDLFIVTSPELSDELRHLEKVVGLVVSTAVAKVRPELAHLLPLLLSSTHHSHSQSSLPLEEANLTLVSPHYQKVGYFKLLTLIALLSLVSGHTTTTLFRIHPAIYSSTSQLYIFRKL